MIYYLADLINYFDLNPTLGGKSTLGILLFWIPRALWPDKPTLLVTGFCARRPRWESIRAIRSA
jgi:hypothetical protein